MTRTASNEPSAAPAPMTPWPALIERFTGPLADAGDAGTTRPGALAEPDWPWWPEYYEFLLSGVADLLGLPHTCPRRQCRTDGFCGYDRDRRPCSAALPRESPILAAMLLRFLCREEDRVNPGWDDDVPDEAALLAEVAEETD